MKQSLNRFLQNAWLLFLFYAFGILLFAAYRMVFMMRIGGNTDWMHYKIDVLKAFLTGFRFDTMVLCYGLVVPLFLSLLLIFIGNSRYHAFTLKFSRVFFTWVLFIFCLVLVVDIYYYNYFQSHINLMIFGFVEDDTGAVMASLWSDYPLLRVLLFFIVLFFFIRWVTRKIFNKIKDHPRLPVPAALLLTLLTLVVFFLGLRGRFGTFPLQIDDAVVSTNSAVNNITLNGVYAFKEAFKFRKGQSDFSGNENRVAGMGFANSAQAIGKLIGNTLPAPCDEVCLRKMMFAKTGKNEYAASHPPHVVFFQMESMSNNNLFLHQPGLNLLGSLEKHWNKNILLRNFLPFANGTIASLEGLMLSTPITTMAQSKYKYHSFSTSVAIPFRKAGYQTTYITGGKGGWRNIDEFIPRQQFDNFESKVNVMNALPEATECEWGVYDEYLFDYIFDKLAHAGHKPQFVFAMTTTNHTPFHLPDHYKPYPVTLSDSIRKRLLTSPEIAVKNLTNLQYSNDCLGRFLDRIQSSPFAANTIIAATGDHNNLMLFDFREDQLWQRLSVPLFMYVPEAYRNGKNINENTWASHNDIFPTLFNLSLSEAEYFNCGNNLFDEVNTNNFISINFESAVAMNSSGMVLFEKPYRYFEWNENEKTFRPASAPAEALNELRESAAARFAAVSWFIRSDVHYK